MALYKFYNIVLYCINIFWDIDEHHRAPLCFSAVLTPSKNVTTYLLNYVNCKAEPQR